MPLDRRSFADFKDIHAGENVWVFGTGPSLDGVLASGLVDDAMAKQEPMIYINHAVKILVQEDHDIPQYCVAGDNETWRSFPGAPAWCTSFVERGYIDIWRREDPYTATSIEAAAKCGDAVLCNYASPSELPTDRDKVSELELLYACQGSATPAVFLAWYMGARHIHLVGVDRKAKTHAKAALAVYTPKQVEVRKRSSYNIILSSALRVLRLLQGTGWTHHTWNDSEATC